MSYYFLANKDHGATPTSNPRDTTTDISTANAVTVLKQQTTKESGEYQFVMIVGTNSNYSSFNMH